LQYPRNMPKTLKSCPICRKPVKPSLEHYPFCSERCRIFDLANWSTESYVVSSPVTEADEHLESGDLSGDRRPPGDE
jgi:endogenous inhibitor of DNA gyrase (YacG/DUF329 family)